MRQEKIDWMRVRGYSEQTIRGRHYLLGYFIDWCQERSITRPHDVTPTVLERYRRYLYYCHSDDGKPLAVGSQSARLSALRGFFRWLTQQHHILYNPAADMELPRQGKRLPRYVLSIEEVEKIMSAPDLTSPFGVRDRAILETFYSTGIRRGELACLDIHNVSHERSVLSIQKGKGNKDRVVPVGERALAWLNKYIQQVRAEIVVEPDDGALFLNQHGRRISRQCVTLLVRGYLKSLGLSQYGACHLFRHSMATAMLENGADIRVIQSILGHAALSTTAMYTQVSIRMLQETHSSTHPTAHLKSLPK